MSKVLVIDDDANIRFLVTKALELKGFEVIQAADGLAGVKAGRTQQPDLIISDVNMEQIDGLAVVSVFKMHPATANVPIILMTGQADLAGMRRAMSLGVDDYLAKPFSIPDLLASVNMQLTKRQARQADADQRTAELRSHISTSMPYEMLAQVNGIVGVADILLAGAQGMPPEETMELASFIRSSGHRLHRLASNFLFYTQIELMASDVKKVALMKEGEAVHMGELLKSHAIAKAQEFGRSADLVMELKSAMVVVAPDHLVKMYDELLDNAFRYTKAGTPVRVSSGTTGQQVRAAITDGGPGLKPDQLAKIGALPEATGKANEHGAGLGLVIVKRLTELYGGRLVVESTLDAGTTARILFPIK
jgi:two-component system, sensor histidine kinase and response regulator